MNYEFLLVLAIILLSTKIFGIASQKVHMPAVVGALLAGILLGPSGFNMLESTPFIEQTAEIGVIMLMFLAGLDTDIEELKKNGMASAGIAVIGVLLPLAGGFFVHRYFFGAAPVNSIEFLKSVFVGVVLTATSVSITVETLREMGKLKGRMGTAILGAAIIDDIIGIIILTFVTSFTDVNSNPATVFGRVAGFFIFVVIVGFVAHYLFKKVYNASGETRRVAVYGLSFCFMLSFCAEHFFGIADITGAYFAGIILCSFGFKEYIVKKINVSSYMLFSPIFFASIGIKTELSGFTPAILAFTGVLLVVAVLTKTVGCALGAMAFKFPKREALAIGIGMVSRGEVALIVAQKGFSAGLLDAALFPAIVTVVIVTTLITPILLKFVISEKNTSENEVEEAIVA